MTKLKPRAIIFDLGSTLIDYEPMPWDEWRRLCGESARGWLVDQGFSVPEADEFHDQYDTFRRPLMERAQRDYVEWSVEDALPAFVRSLEIDLTNDEARELFDAYYAPVDDRLTIFDDTLATLDALRDVYRPIGLVSNTIFPERAHRRELDRFDIAPRLDFAIFSSAFGRRKPHPSIFQEACAQAGVEPGEAVYVGDRWLEDIEGPAQIGMSAILKVTENREYPDDFGNTRTIDRLEELRDHIAI